MFSLQETWLSDNSDTSLIQIDNYTLISKGKTCSTHGGLLIYLHNTYHYKTILTNIKSDIWEGQFISVTTQQTNKKITIGNIYRPPRDINANYQKFIDEFTKVLTELQGSKGEVVIAGDYNIDLLKIGNRPMIKEYLDSIITLGFFPKITFPTRFSEQHGTLIDNVLYKISDKFFTATSGIIVSQLSDHLPYFVCIDIDKLP